MYGDIFMKKIALHKQLAGISWRGRSKNTSNEPESIVERNVRSLSSRSESQKALLYTHTYTHKVKWRESHSVVPNSLLPHGLPALWNSPGQNTGVGSLSLLQGIFPTQDWTYVSCIAGRFFTNWAIREHRHTTTFESMVVCPWCLYVAVYLLPWDLSIWLTFHHKSA